jgi:hypothetical protein
MQSFIRLRSSTTSSVAHHAKDMNPKLSLPTAKKPTDNRFLGILMSALAVWAV